MHRVVMIEDREEDKVVRYGMAGASEYIYVCTHAFIAECLLGVFE
jgi:hypothetical protein